MEERHAQSGESAPKEKMDQPAQSPSNGFVAAARKIYNPIGFTKGYNFVLFFIFGGALMGFTLARFQYLDIDNVFCGSGNDAGNSSLPGECYWYSRGFGRAAMLLHLAGVLPGSFLAVFQFVPVIRRRATLFHRINGYVVVLLAVAGTVGGLMLARDSVGGGLSVQMAAGVIGIMFVVAMVLAWVNVKRLQIEQHRAWMLRAWFYAGSIVTVRPIMMVSALIISHIGGYHQAMPCKVVHYLVSESNPASRTAELFPGCEAFLSGDEPEEYVSVEADFHNRGNSAVPVAAALQISFTMAICLAFILHAVGVEIYLHLTPREAERLRNVSYQRQLEAGMKHPGRAGLTSDRMGDAETWEPKLSMEKAKGTSSGDLAEDR